MGFNSDLRTTCVSIGHARGKLDFPYASQEFLYHVEFQPAPLIQKAQAVAVMHAITPPGTG
jgi:hypothetical protein